MGYDKKKWDKRLRSRSDIGGFLTHLTRANEKLSVVDVLIKILNDKEIIGSNPKMGFIMGNTSAVCFQDAPVYGLSQNLIHEQYNKEELGGKVRYSGVGLGFTKKYAYMKGARPVIYETKEIGKSILDESEWWRIVSFDLSDDQNIIDWTHEREWRINGDFTFELNEVYVYLVNGATYKKFMEKASQDVIKGIKGIVVLDPILT